LAGLAGSGHLAKHSFELSQAGDLGTDVREVLHCELLGLAATHARPSVMQPQELPYLV